MLLGPLHGSDRIFDRLFLGSNKTQPLEQGQQKTEGKANCSARLAAVLEHPDRDIVLPGAFCQLTTGRHHQEATLRFACCFEGIQRLLCVAGMRRADHQSLCAAGV